MTAASAPASIMQRILPALVLGLALSAGAATEIEGVAFADEVEIGSKRLQLNGAGLRKRFFFKVYVVGLYLTSPAGTATEALAADGPKRVRIVTMREVAAEKFAGALMDGVRANQTPEGYARIEARVLDLRSRILAKGSAAEGTEIVLDLLPEAGTMMRVNGAPLGDPIPGPDFQRALLSVWLGHEPVDRGLRDALAPTRP